MDSQYENTTAPVEERVADHYEEEQVALRHNDDATNSNNPQSDTNNVVDDEAANAELYANAVECANSPRTNNAYNNRRSTNSNSTVTYLNGITSATKAGDVNYASELVKGLEEQDAKLFTEIPSQFRSRQKPRTSDDREGSIARRSEYHNANYSVPERQPTFSPRTFVDVRRPLTARYDPSSPEARKARSQGGATSRYSGLSSGDTKCFDNDPIYQPQADSRRQQIEAAKQAERSQMVRPHSAAQIARKKGPAPREPNTQKREAGWVPNAASYAENSNNDGRTRRQEAQSRMSTITPFK